MNTDMLHDTFKDLEAGARALDPERVLAGARRRRRRRTALTGAASLGVAAVTIASFALAGATAPGSDAPVAGQSAVAADPPVIGDGTWYQLSATQSFRINGTSWRLEGRPGTTERTAIVGGLDKADLARGWGPPLSGGHGRSWHTLSILEGDIRRVVIRVEGESGVFQHEAKVHRLGARPGWVLAYVEYPPPGPVDARGAVGKLFVGLDAYDATGRRVWHCDPPPHASAKDTPPTIACSTG